MASQFGGIPVSRFGGEAISQTVAPQSAQQPTIQEQAIPQQTSEQKLASMIQDFGHGRPMSERNISLIQEILDRRGSPLKYGELVQKPDDSMHAKEFFEPLVTLGTSMVAEPVAGFAGIAGSALPGKEGQGADWVEATRKALTYTPETEQAQKSLTEFGKLIEPAGKVFTATEKALGDFAYDVTGSPTIAAAAATTPTAILELLSLKGLKDLAPGTRLIDDAGRPTKVLRRELDKKGLNFESLTPEVKEAIPSQVDPSLIPGGKPASRAVEDVLVKQIEAGAKEDALAGLKVEGGKLVTDQVGTEAIKQGFRPGTIQAIKTSDSTTKSMMREMLNKMRAIKKNERLGLEMRPTDVVGNALTDRIKFISKKADEARKELDGIAKTELAGQAVDTDLIFNALDDGLSDLNVRIVEDAAGVPKVEYSGSLVSKDRSSKRVINDLVDLLGEREIDARRAHDLKRQLDIMIDFNKKSAMGLSDAGKKVLKKVRRALNDSIREVNPDYARVNDTLSTSLDALGSLDEAVGTIDIFGKGAEKAIGQKLRALLSNQQGRIRLENAIENIEVATSSLGGSFGGDIKDLVMFADALDDKFGTVAKTSFAGQVEQAVSQATASPKAAVAGAVTKKVGSGLEKLRGINDFNAFESLDKLLQ